MAGTRAAFRTGTGCHILLSCWTTASWIHSPISFIKVIWLSFTLCDLTLISTLPKGLRCWKESMLGWWTRRACIIQPFGRRHSENGDSPYCSAKLEIEPLTVFSERKVRSWMCNGMKLQTVGIFYMKLLQLWRRVLRWHEITDVCILLRQIVGSLTLPGIAYFSQLGACRV